MLGCWDAGMLLFAFGALQLGCWDAGMLLLGQRFTGFVGFIEFVVFIELLTVIESKRSRSLWTFFSTRSSRVFQVEKGI